MLWTMKTLIRLLGKEKPFDQESAVKRIVAKLSSGSVWLRQGKYITDDELNSRLNKIKTASI